MEKIQEIHQIVNRLPHDFVDDLLNYLRKAEDFLPEKQKRSLNFRTILLEDQEVLKKLAQ